jgi:hypothetical protein
MVKAIAVAAALALVGIVGTLGRAMWRSRKWRHVGEISGIDPRD